MGLDISAYSGLTLTDDESDYTVSLYKNPDFPGRADDFDERKFYLADDSIQFRAGSYGGYNWWREQLAGLVGTTPRQLWNTQAPGPFAELINFSDAEGTLGTAICAKLASDFATHQADADRHADEWFREMYAKWRAAFELAANGGAVCFH